MDRLDTAILAPTITRAAILARIDVIERETAAALLQGVSTAAEYRAINNILGHQHAEARVYASAPRRP